MTMQTRTVCICDICGEEYSEDGGGFHTLKYWVGRSADPHGKRYDDYKEVHVCYHTCNLLIAHPDTLTKQEQFIMATTIFKNKGRLV